MVNRRYEHYAGITSQIHFCASPIRLDTQSECQMGCTYCFAKARGGFRGDPQIKFVPPLALAKRLTRAAEGRPIGAFEEFLERRIPLQLGGMTDPFSKSSVTNKTIFEILEVLNRFDYPTLISTKGSIADIAKALPLLESGNYYVRFSIAASRFAKKDVEPGTPSESEILDTLSLVAEHGVPTCLRLQPIFPDAEQEAIQLAIAAKLAGAKAVSLEYLKLPQDRNTSQFRALDSLYGGGVRAVFEDHGVSTDGRELSLSLERRTAGMKALKRALNDAGVRVGIAENELLHYGDLSGCCNGGTEFLREARNFDYNVIGIIRDKPRGPITFSMASSRWKPTAPVGRHFNSHSRFGLKGAEATWENFFRLRWNETSMHFNPSFFDGVTPTGETDDEGNAVYHYDPDNGWPQMSEEEVAPT